MKTVEIWLLALGIPALMIILAFALAVILLYTSAMLLAALCGVNFAQEWFRTTFKGLPDSMSFIPHS